MLTLRPRMGLCLIRLIEQKETKTNAGIIVPNSEGAMWQEAELLAVGPGIPNEHGVPYGTDDLKVGMRVLVKSGGQMGGMQTRLPVFASGGQNISMVNYQDIHMVLDGSPDLKITE